MLILLNMMNARDIWEAVAENLKLEEDSKKSHAARRRSKLEGCYSQTESMGRKTLKEDGMCMFGPRTAWAT